VLRVCFARRGHSTRALTASATRVPAAARPPLSRCKTAAHARTKPTENTTKHGCLQHPTLSSLASDLHDESVSRADHSSYRAPAHGHTPPTRFEPKLRLIRFNHSRVSLARRNDISGIPVRTDRESQLKMLCFEGSWRLAARQYAELRVTTDDALQPRARNKPAGFVAPQFIPLVCAFVAPRHPGASAAIIDRLGHSQALSARELPEPI
jgi:hypothetical protein